MFISTREDVARLIKAAAASQGVTVSGLAVRLGVSQPSLSRTINRADVTVSDLLRIGQALGLRLRIQYDDSGRA